MIGRSRYAIRARRPAIKPFGISNSEGLTMVDEPQPPPIVDPDSVPEILCDGPLNVAAFGNLVALTFTHIRPRPGVLFQDGRIETEAVVRARIVLTTQRLVGLRDLLNRITREPQVPTPAAGVAPRH